jgi:hypothetical protein
MITKLVGPKSKFDKSLPYTYEAKMPVMDGLDIYNYYLSDTICGLIEYLEQNKIKPADVEIFELFQKKEKLIPQDLYSTKEGDWLHIPELCRSFKEQYKGHIDEGKCSFNDRDRQGIGP